MIPLLPPLVEFMDPKSLCRYSRTSKTLQKDVRDTKAWEILARAQMPRKTRDAASEALSQVKSHVRRRLLADAMALETPQPQTFRPNEIEDFTFFVRFVEDASPTRAAPTYRDRYRRRASPSPTPTRPPPRGRVVWEGDLRYDPTMNGFIDGFISFDLRPVWDAIRRAESWPGMERILKNPVTFGSVDANVNYLQRCKISIVAIRDQDEAMVSVGQFIFDNPSSPIGNPNQHYDFRSRTTLFSSPRFNLQMMANLEAVHNAEGHGSVDVLVLRLKHYSPEIVRNDGYVDPATICGESQFAYLLSYLAGTHDLARESALETIENWHVEAMAFSQYN